MKTNDRDRLIRNTVYGFMACMAICFIFLSAGCGDDPSGVEQTVITGQALKGPVSGAAVNIYKIMDGIYDDIPLGSGTTNADGGFTVNIGTYRGPALIEVSGGEYIDERDGTMKPLLSPLRAVLTNAAGKMTLSVNYLTELAADYAMSAFNGLTVERIAAANKQASVLVGGTGATDLITTVTPNDPSKPTQSSDSVITNYTAMIGASSFIAPGADVSSFASARQALADALTEFAASSANLTGLTPSDASGLSAHFLSASYSPLPDTGVDTCTFTLLQTTDLHNRASGYGVHADYTPLTTNDDDVKGGYSRLASKIEDVREERRLENIPVVLIDSGDFLMGTAYDLTVEDPVSLRFLDMMDYDATTIGNHEFDYSPVGLGLILDNGIKAGFDVPIIATNTVMDGKPGTSDDALEDLKRKGVIREDMVMQLPNGCKIGFIGLMGESSDTYAPAAPPVTFNHDTEFIKARVDHLKNNLGVDIVIALSHSGIQNPNESPEGDDIDLADAAPGIDIIASGHDHETTRSVVERNGVRIICAGSYGKNLARLDITYRKSAKAIETAALTNIPIDDRFMGAPWVQTVIDEVDAALNKGLKDIDPELSLEAPLAYCKTGNLGMPGRAGESGMGNLTSDAVRYLLNLPVSLGVLTTPTVGLIGNGVIRGAFEYGQDVSFADAFSVLPLGMTPATDQSLVMPGYPMMLVYVSGAELKNICRFTAYVIASEDSDFKAALAQGDDAQKTLLFILNNISGAYYMNMSGVKWSHNGPEGGYQVSDVEVYAPDDYQCKGETTPVQDDVFYPCVVDIYSLMLLNSDIMQMGLAMLDIPIKPKFNPIQSDFTNLDLKDIETEAQMLKARIDGDPDVLGGAPGVQEVKEWQALLLYLAEPAANGALGGIITDTDYGAGSLGRVSHP